MLSPILTLPAAYWVHDLSPFLLQFSENFGIRYYGLAYLLGFFGGVAMLHWYHRRGRSPFGPSMINDLMTYIIIGVLVGGRLGYFFLYQMGSVRTDPLVLFRIWEGGMSSHGGFIGVVAAMAWYARKRRVGFFQLSDIIASVTPVGLLLGRIANFINGELWGKITNVPWAIIFPQSATPGTPVSEIPARHPSQLYQAGLEGALLLAYAQWRFWRSATVRQHPGRLSGEFLIAYAVLRIVGELFREPDASLLFGLSRGTFYSIFFIVVGFVILRRSSVQPTR